MNGLLLATLAVFAGSLALAGALASARSGARRRRLGRRVARAAGKAAPRRAPEGSIRLEEGGGRWAGLDRLAGLLPGRARDLRARLARTGRRITVGAYAAASLATGAAAALAALAAGLPAALAPLPGLALGLVLPRLAVSFLIARREKAFAALFPDAIDLIVRGLRSGLPIGEQIGAVGGEIAEPVGSEFRRVAHAIRFGQTMDEALQEAARRLSIPDFDFFVVSLAVQRETGGNLAETLQNLSDMLRKRRQMRLKIRAMASEARASATILGVLPFLMFGILMLVNPGYMSLLVTDPRGHLMIAFGLFWGGIGILAMARMVRFEI
jgi:tight adherence protein B